MCPAGLQGQRAGSPSVLTPHSHAKTHWGCPVERKHNFIGINTRRQKEKLHQINHARPQLIYTFYYNYRIVLFYHSILNANSPRRTISFNINIHWTTQNMRVTQMRQITYWLKHLNQHVAWLINSSNQSSSKK